MHVIWEDSHVQWHTAPRAYAKEGPRGETRGPQPDAPHKRAAMSVRAGNYLRRQPQVQWHCRAWLVGLRMDVAPALLPVGKLASSSAGRQALRQTLLLP